MEQKKLLAGRESLSVEGGYTLRLLSAFELLQARREAAALAEEDRELALCANACVLARALERHNGPVFTTGLDALKGLTALQIEQLAGRWASLQQEENPSAEDGEERLEPLKKAWSTRLMSAFSGACSVPLARFRQRQGPDR